MEHDITPFWADIKKYEEELANDPASYCFVALADLYRRIGFLDDAIHVAKKGCDVHPDFVGGYMALGRSYFEKGMKLESKAALEKVIASTPDNLMARRLLSQIYVEHGEIAAATETLRFLLSSNPEDQESQLLLNSLKTSSIPDHAHLSPAAASPEEFDFFADEDDIIEDAELLEELDESVAPEEGEFFFTPPDEALAEMDHAVCVKEHDPLRTATMAELYVSQGFLKRALTIYRELLEIEPNNTEWKNRLYELKTAIDEDTAMARQVAAAENSTEGRIPLVSGQPDTDMPTNETPALVPADARTLGELEKWLATIRRRR